MKLDTQTARLITCEVFGISIDELLSKKRTNRIAFARHALSHALVAHLGYTQLEASIIVGRGRDNVCRAIKASRALFQVNQQYASNLKELMFRFQEKLNS